MSPRTFASICTSLPQRREVLLLVRSLSCSAAHEELTLTELAEKPSASTTEPLFGIAPRKLRNLEDEDFVSTSPSSRPQDSSLAAHKNYFSQTWAEQKRGSLVKGSNTLDDQSDPLDKEVVSPGPFLPTSLRQHIPTRISAPNRVWLVAPDLQASDQETFTFTSFKVLASEVALRHQTQLFKHVPSGILNWKSRSRKILAGLELCAADIICLQEVDRFSHLQSELSCKGYAGLFKASSGTEPYGCAVFWRQERFQLLHEESVEFSSLGMRENVAQLCVLQSTVPGTSNMGATFHSGNSGLSQSKRLIVGNIDVLFNPKRGHIKLGQCRAFLEQVHKLATLWPGAPLIIGGCFHLTPQSALYNFLVNSRLDVYGLECQYLSGQALTPASSVRSGPKSVGATNMTSSGKGKPSLDLRKRLRKSLLAKFASEHGTDALDFASSAKEILSSTSSIVSSSASVSNDRQIYKNERTPSKVLVSKTIEILRSDFNSPPLRSMAKNASVMDAAPSISKVMDTDTLPADASTSSELVESCGTEVPEQKSLHGFEGAPMKACSVPSTAYDEVSCDTAAPECTLPGDTTKENTNRYISGHPPGPSSPDHGWDLEELKIATGRVDSTVAKHELKLFSVYPEVPGNSKTRDEKGEPRVTMCHKEFKGTVDYIWRSEGLQTAKVLETFSLTDMMLMPALPFMACGSDHIYLACELTFTSH